jgi:hypothetical protein
MVSVDTIRPPAGEWPTSQKGSREMEKPVARVKSWLLLTVLGVVAALASQGLLLMTQPRAWHLNSVPITWEHVPFSLLTLVGVLIAVYGVLVGATDKTSKQAARSLSDLRSEVAALRADLASYQAAMTIRQAEDLGPPDTGVSPAH